MAYSMHLFVKYKPEGSSEVRNPVEIAAGEAIPLPNVGDIVDCKNVGGAVEGRRTSTGYSRAISRTGRTTAVCS
jgi:hypothetical protein